MTGERATLTTPDFFANDLYSQSLRSRWTETTAIHGPIRVQAKAKVRSFGIGLLTLNGETIAPNHFSGDVERAPFVRCSFITIPSTLAFRKS